MLVYSSTKEKFSKDVDSNDIKNIILHSIEKTGKSVGASELNSWQDSLSSMDRLLYRSTVPDDAGVSIEYHIPQTSKRVDFIITGRDEHNVECAIIIELKGWVDSQLTEKDAVVKTFFQGRLVETTHPCYQAWSYASLLSDFNETVEEENVLLKPCAYLHNHHYNDVINDPFYEEHIQRAPLFLKNDAQLLRDFIEKYIKYGDDNQLMYRIDNGRIRPSKHLADRLVSMINGNQEFTMIDEQKVVYETALLLSRVSNSKNKNVLIVEGGLGTGKSIVAINLLVELTRRELLVQYVTKNSAPRHVYESKLTGSMKKSSITNLFKGSGAYTNSDGNNFDVLIVDEAHRLNEKSGMFKNQGENQIKEIIFSSKFSVFFIDECQQVTLQDIGTLKEITKWAKDQKADIHKMELSSQFRCNGSDGYLAWLDNMLQIRETANESFEDFDFRVIDSPTELSELIFEKNKLNNKARLVAGYCWNWISKKNPEAFDIEMPEYDFKMKWNLTKDGMLWIISPESVNEIGCIHTCQGLELDYIGVIIGKDLLVRNNKIITNPSARAKTDQSLKGFVNIMKTKPDEIQQTVSKLIKNTYRTLMTIGMKGCYIYCVDQETSEYFQNQIKKSTY